MRRSSTRCTRSAMASLRRAQSRASARGPTPPVFVFDNEAAVEVSNALLHAILHLGWVEQPDGTYRGQMGIYVKHRGAKSRLYMQAIAPFRHLIVYPSLLRRIGKSWDASVAEASSADNAQAVRR